MKIISRISKFIKSQSSDAEGRNGDNEIEASAFRDEISKSGTISAELLEDICEKHPKLNPIWILTGKGEMLIDDYHEIGKAYDNVDSDDGIYNVIAGKDIEIQLLKEHIEGLNELIRVKNNLIDEYKNG